MLQIYAIVFLMATLTSMMIAAAVGDDIMLGF